MTDGYAALAFFTGLAFAPDFFVACAFSFAANSCFTVRAIASVSTLYALAASRRTPVQELLRYANSSVTLNLYAQAVTDIKRNAQSKVARLVFQSEKAQEEE